MQDPSNKLFLLSNNAMLNREAFYQKFLAFFKEAFSPEEFKHL